MIRKEISHALLSCSAAVLAAALPASAYAQVQRFEFDIRAQPLDEALRVFARTTRQQVLFDGGLVRGKRSAALTGSFTAEAGLDRLLAGSGLRATRGSRGAYVIKPVEAAMADDGARPAAVEAVPDNGEIIVTAQKREQRLQDVPSSMTALSGDQLEAQGQLQLADYAKQIPGMSLIGGSGPGQGQVVLRGITTGSDHTGSVSLYLDDIPLTASSVNSGNQTALSSVNHSFDPDLADIERIEVLEGPQSTLYGASAEGGTIKFVTRKPNLTAVEGSMRAALSQIDGGGTGYGLRGSVNLPLIEDRIALRASAFYRHDPGFIDNRYYGHRNVNSGNIAGGTLTLRARLSDSVENTLTGLYQDIEADDVNQVYLTGSGATLRPTLGRTSYSSPIDQSSRSKYLAIGNTTTIDLTFATLTNVASYAHMDSTSVVDFGALSPAIGGAPVRYEGNPVHARYSDELRLASAKGRLEWLLGAFYTREKDDWNINIRPTDGLGNILAPTSPIYNIYTFLTASVFKEKAVFGTVTYHFTPQLEGALGIRYSANHQSFHVISTGLLGVDDSRGTSKDSATNYLATISYKPSDDLTFYVRAASAYRPGGPNTGLTPAQIAAGVPTSFKSDQLWNYEAGVKGSLLDRRLRFAASLYRMDWTDVQITIIVQNFASYGNAARARSEGAQASIDFEPVRDLTIGLKAAYVNSRLTADAPSISGSRGDQLPFSPKFSATVPVDYRFALGDGLSGTLGLTFAHRGAQLTGFTAAGRTVLPSYETLDLRAGLDWSRYSLLARIDNVTNSSGVTSAQNSYAGGAPIIGEIVRPRTFALSLQARF